MKYKALKGATLNFSDSFGGCMSPVAEAGSRLAILHRISQADFDFISNLINPALFRNDRAIKDGFRFRRDSLPNWLASMNCEIQKISAFSASLVFYLDRAGDHGRFTTLPLDCLTVIIDDRGVEYTSRWHHITHLEK